MTTIDTILESLGGEAAVARSLQLGVSAISNWKVRGIPPGRKYDLLALAERHEIALSIADIEAADRAIAEQGRRSAA
jgi:hypothetical protein